MISHMLNDHHRTIKCEICDSRFISKAQLEKHMDKEHKKKQALLLNLPKPVPALILNLPKPVPLGIPTIATQESTTERYIENV